MRRRPLPESHGNHPNVTPLIDIVMCLIIFFMLVAKIGVSTGADPTIEIPASVLGQELKDPGQALTLNVRPGVGDEPMVTALVEGTTNQPQEIKLSDPATHHRPLLETLQKIKAGPDGKPNTADDKDLKIIIRGDKEMGYKYLEPVLITCMEAKVKNVNFNTSKAVQAITP
jgi:biopolymer transport protein ExbD